MQPRHTPASTQHAAFNVLLCTTILSSGLFLATSVSAQSTDATPPPRQVVDQRGVDVASGKAIVSTPPARVADAKFASVWNGTIGQTSLDAFIKTSGGNFQVYLGGAKLFGGVPTAVFAPNGSGGYDSVDQDGSKFEVLSGYQNYKYTAPDGTVYIFYNMTGSGTSGPPFSIIKSSLQTVTQPDGRVFTYNYKYDSVPVCGHTCYDKPYLRVQSITSSDGYMLKATYAGSTAASGSFNTVTSVAAIDLSVDYCDPSADTCGSLTQSWPTQTIGSSSVTDPNGNVIGVTTGTNGVTAVTQPASSGDDTAVTYDGTGKVATVTEGGVTSTYTYIDSGGSRTTTITGPGSTTETYVTDIASTRLTSVTDQTGKTTTYLYDTAGRKTRETLPEGNYTNWTYDSRGNVTEARMVAKVGSGIADIVTSENFDTTCSNILTCNKPNYAIDAKGNRTDYTYNSTHGGLTQVKLPAPAAGQPRPEIDYTYTALYGQAKTGGGTLVTSTIAQYKVTQITMCATAATCAGTANETKITLAYNTPNLMLTSKTVAAGDGSVSATTTYAYDAFDNAVSVDGPLAGTADTTYYFYDALHNVIGIISPDPDGAAALKRRAVRYTYDAQSRLTKTEIGTATGTTLSDLTGMAVSQTLDTTYDSNGNKIKNVLSAGGTTYQVAQYSYDTRNRLECTALRMNPAVFGALPSSACTLGTTGSAGPDRISRTTYDAADRVLKVQLAYGTTDQADEATGTYTNNGKLGTLTDAQGNITTYEYDGVDRLSKTRYPVATVGAGASSTTDYEQLGYDANGNVTSRLLRGGTQTINYTYDNLNRLTMKDLPGSELDVTLGYDLLGRLKSAATSAQTLSFTYDALGRNLTQTSPLGTVGYQYDAAGRRTRLTWPDTYYVTYDYQVTGEVTTIKENGTTTLGTYVYDDLGRRTTLTRGNGVLTSYGFDPVSRLSSLTSDLTGTTSDLALGFSYNPASQITSTTRSNNAFSWTGAANVARNYTSNGLNQYSAATSTTFGYDARGNLTSSGSNTYTYSSENLLLTGPNSASLIYDPLLRLYQSGSASVGASKNLYDGNQQIASYLASSGALTQRYIMGSEPDEELLEITAAGVKTWTIADERGSVIGGTDTSGNAAGVNTYDEYGIPGASNTLRRQYTGQVWLPELGMYYYKARMYSPTMGRFMQTDPVGYGDGMNWYNYVGSDPANLTDPSGRNACTDLGLFTVVPGYSYDDSDSGDRVIIAPTCGGLLPKLTNKGDSGGSSGNNTGGGGGEAATRRANHWCPQEEGDSWVDAALKVDEFVGMGADATSVGAEVVAGATLEASPPALGAHGVALAANIVSKFASAAAIPLHLYKGDYIGVVGDVAGMVTARSVGRLAEEALKNAKFGKATASAIEGVAGKAAEQGGKSRSMCGG